MLASPQVSLAVHLATKTSDNVTLRTDDSRVTLEAPQTLVLPSGITSPQNEFPKKLIKTMKKGMPQQMALKKKE